MTRKVGNKAAYAAAERARQKAALRNGAMALGGGKVPTAAQVKAAAVRAGVKADGSETYRIESPPLVVELDIPAGTPAQEGARMWDQFCASIIAIAEDDDA